MRKKDLKRYIVRKYIVASSVKEAIKKDKKTEVDDVWVDEDFKKDNPRMGFIK